RRRLSNCGSGCDRQVTQDCVVKLECEFQLFKHSLVTFDIHEHVMCLVNLLNWVSQLTATPVFQAMHRTAIGSHQIAITLDHRRHLLTLVRMNDKNYFIMSHIFSFWINRLSSMRNDEPRLMKLA